MINHKTINEWELEPANSRTCLEQALLENDIQPAALIEALEEGIAVQDRSGRIVACNTSAERILGLSADQIMRRTTIDPAWKATHEDGSDFPGDEHPATITFRTGQPCSKVVMGVRKPDGTQSWISINTRPLCRPADPQPYAVVVSFRDISDRLQTYLTLEKRIQERAGQVNTFLDVTRDVASTLELKPLLTIILQRLQQVVNYTDAGIAILENDYFKIVEFRGEISREKMLQFRVPITEDSGYRRVMQTCRPVIIADIWENIPWLKQLQDSAGAAIRELYRDIHSWIGVPLLVRDHLVGVLRLDDKMPGYYTEERVRLVMAFADHAAVAIENARVHEQSQALSVLRERQKLARELHDSVSQALYGITLGIRTAQLLLERDPLQAKEPLEYCLSLANAGMAEMRSLIFELRPESLEQEGIVAALTKRSAALSRRYALEVRENYCAEPQVSLPVKEVLFRIAQEATHNIVKHAHADQVEICLEQAGDRLELTIRDNGQGFEVLESYPGHLGLKSMAERAEEVGGSFEVISAPGQGTLIRVRVPI